MKIEFSRSLLEEKLSYARAFTETRSSIPMLGSVLCEAMNLDGGRNVLKITTTNLEISYIGFVDCDVIEEGQVCVNAQKFYEITKAISKESEATLSTNKDKNVVLKSQRSKFTLKTLDPEEFPKLTKINKDVSIPINPFTLHRTIRLAKLGTSKALQTGRVILESLLFEFIVDEKATYLVNVGTDGHRLSMVKNDITFSLDDIAADKCPDWIANGRKYILPITGLQQVERVVSDYLSGLKEGDVEVPVECSIDEKGSAIGFAINDSVLHLQTLNASYPGYEELMSAEFEISMRLNRELISEALKRVSVLTDTKHREIRVKAQEEGLCHLSHTSPELGEASDSVPCDLTGKPWDLGFNAKYLADGISGVPEGEDVLIELPTKLRPARIRGSREQEKIRYTYLIMPTR